MNALDLKDSSVLWARNPAQQAVDRTRIELHWTCDEAGNWSRELITRRRVGNGWIVSAIKNSAGHIVAERPAEQENDRAHK